MTTLTKTQPQGLVFSRALAGRIALALALSVSSGILLLLAFPPYGAWPLIWLGFVPYLVAQHRLLPSRWSRLAPAIALGVWLTPFLARLFGPEMPWPLRYLGIIIAVLTFFTGNTRKFHEYTGYRWFVLQGATDWVGFELVRSFIPVTATAAFVANTMATQPWIIQPVSIFSIYGLNLLVMFVNFALAQGAMALIDQWWKLEDAVAVNPRGAVRWLAGVAAATVVWVGVSLIILSGAPQDAETVRVAALQPNLTIPGQFVVDADQEARLELLTEQAYDAAEQGAEAIFISELAFGFDPQVEHTEEFRALAAATGAYIYIPYGFWNDQGWRNETVLLAPDGEFMGVYGKSHVFPGEQRIVTSGVYPVNDTPLGQLASAICHDGNFTDITRRLARNGAQLVAIPTFENSGWGEQQWTHAVFRAVENRVAVVQTGTAYSSAIVDPYGRIVDIEVTPAGAQNTLVADVPLGTGQTPTVFMGDWMGWIVLAALIVFTVYMSIVKRKVKKAQSE